MGFRRYLPLRVKHIMLLEDLGNNRNGGIDGIRDDQDESFWCKLGDASRKVSDDARVDLSTVSKD